MKNKKKKSFDDKLQDKVVDKYTKETLKIYKNLLKILTPILIANNIDKINKVLEKELDKAGATQVALATSLLTIVSKSKIKDKKLIKDIIEDNWSGEKFSDRIYKEKKVLKKVLKKEIKNALINNEEKDVIAHRVSKKLDVSISTAKRLIDTEASNVLAKAEIIKGQNKGHTHYKIEVTLDDRTSDICREIARKDEIFKIGTPPIYGVNMVPAHPHCRSRIVTF